MSDLLTLDQSKLDEMDKLGKTHLKEIEKLEANFDTVLEPAPSIKGAMAVHNAGRANLWLCDPAVLQIIEGFNPRVFTAAYNKRINDLADSMLANGWYPNSVLNGFTAVENGETVIYVTSGHTRLLALDIANKKAKKQGLPLIDRVPVTVQTKGVSMDDLQIELIRGNTDSSLTPFEQGVVVQRLVRAGFTDAQIESRTGVKNPWLGKLLKLMAAPNQLKMLVAHDVITATLAIDTIEEHKGKALEVLEAALAAKKAQLTGGDTEKPVRVTKKDIAVSPEKLAAKAVMKFAPTMQTTLNRVVADPGLKALSAETRELLAELMASLEKATKEATGGNELEANSNQMDLLGGAEKATA